MRTLSHPPGFEPKVLPQPINQGNQAGYIGYPAKRLQTQMPDALHIPMSHAQPMPTYKGSNIHQMVPHYGDTSTPISASNSTLIMHHTHQGYTTPSHTVVSHGGAQIVPPVTPATSQAYTPYGTIKSAPQLSKYAQPSLHALNYHYNAHIPTQSQEMEHIRPQNASLPNHLLQSAQAIPHMAHIGTPQAHQITQNVCITSGSEHLKPSPSLSQNTTEQASTSLQNSSEKYSSKSTYSHRQSHASKSWITNPNSNCNSSPSMHIK